MNKYRKPAFWLSLLMILGTFNFLIQQKEALIRSGQKLFLPLRPRDPRSLMQGDYMILRYEIPKMVDAAVSKGSRDGFVVLKIDKAGKGKVLRLYQNKPLAKGEHLLAFKRRGSVRFGAESFFFQEGHGKYYDKARFAELRLTSSGKSVLVGLRGPDCKPIAIPSS